MSLPDDNSQFPAVETPDTPGRQSEEPDRDGVASRAGQGGARPSNPNRGPSQSKRGSRHNAGRRANPADPNRAISGNNVPPNRARRGVFSAIDLGTNNCRLLVAKPTNNGFRIIDAFSRIVRLGEGVAQHAELSEAAMDRTIAALKVCAEKIEKRNVTTMRHVATEACRVATNSKEFIERVHEETGLRLDIISPREEARLAVMGCQSLIAPGNNHALVFDIGGGSTELIWVRVHPDRRTEIQGWTSIPWGVVNLTESFRGAHQDVDAVTYAAMTSAVRDHLSKFENRYNLRSMLKNRRVQFLGTSGTVTTLASLHLNLPKYIRSRVDGAWMRSEDIQALSNSVAQMTYSERSAQPCIGVERADLVVAGCAILEAILGMWPVPSLRVADRGIREGILRGLMQMERPPISKNRKRNRRRKRNRNVERVE